MTKQLHPPQRAQGRRRARRRRRADRTGAVRWAKAWAQAAPFKPEKGAKIQLLRWKRFVQSEEDSFMAHGRRLHEGHRRRGQGHQRVARRRAAQGQRGGQHQPGPGHVLGPVLAAAPVPDQVRRRDRRRQLPGQEVRRLGADAPRPTARAAASGSRFRWPTTATSSTTAEHDREGRLQGDPEGHRRLPRADEGAEGESVPGGFALGRASGDGNAWVHWACGRRAPTWSTRTTR